MFTLFKNAAIGLSHYVNSMVSPTIPTWRPVNWRDGLTRENAKAMGWNVLDIAVSVGESAFKAAVISNPGWGVTLRIVFAGQTLKQLTHELQHCVDPEGEIVPRWIPDAVNEITLFVGSIYVTGTPADIYVQNKIVAARFGMYGKQLMRIAFDEELANRTMGFCNDCFVAGDRQLKLAAATAPKISEFANYTEIFQPQYDQQAATFVFNQTIVFHPTDSQYFWQNNLIGNITKEIMYVHTPVGLQATSTTTSFSINNTHYQKRIKFVDNDTTVITETPLALVLPKLPIASIQPGYLTVLNHLDHGWKFFLNRISLPNIFVSAQEVAAHSKYPNLEDDSIEPDITSENINKKNDKGMTPLMSAAKRGHVKTVANLLRRGADHQLKDKDGNTALHHAVLNNRLEVVKSLLRPGEDNRILNNKGDFPAGIAINENRIEILNVLLEHENTYADASRVRVEDQRLELLGIAIDIDNHDAVASIIRIDPEILTRTLVPIYSLEYTTTTYAIEGGAIKVVKYIFENHFESIKNQLYDILKKFLVLKSEASQRLHQQLFKNLILKEEAHQQIFNYIIQFLRDTNFKLNEKYFYLLIEAIGGKNHAFVKELLSISDKIIFKVRIKSSLDENDPNNYRDYLLHYAIGVKDIVSVEMLLNNGADINQLNGDNDTVLHLTMLSYTSSIEMAEYLIKKGVNINAINKFGLTALDVADKRKEGVGRADIDFLESHGALRANAILNARDAEGRTPLMLAADKDDYRQVKKLLKSKVDLSLVDNEGNNVLHYASRGSYKLFKLVVKKLVRGKSIQVRNNAGDTPAELLILNEKIDKNKKYDLFAKLLAHQNTYVSKEQKDAECDEILLAIFKHKDLEAFRVLVQHYSDRVETLLTGSLTELTYSEVRISDAVSQLEFIYEYLKLRKPDINNKLSISLFCYFIRHGTFDQIKNHLSSPNQLIVKNLLGDTPLEVAVMFGRHEILQYFISYLEENGYKYYILQKNNIGNTLLHLAMRFSTVSTKVVEMLLENGVYMNSLNNNIQTALDLAYTHEVSTDFAQTVQAITFLESQGAYRASDFLTKPIPETLDHSNMNDLMLACYEGNVDAVKRLLSSENNIFKTNRQGYTALDIAILRGHLNVVKLFSKSVSSWINRLNSKGYFAAEWAIIHHQDEILEFIDSFSSFYRNENYMAERLLLLARSRNNINAVNMLLSRYSRFKLANNALPGGTYTLKIFYLIYTKDAGLFKAVCQSDFNHLIKEGNLIHIISFLHGIMEDRQNNNLNEIWKYFAEFLKTNNVIIFSTNDFKEISLQKLMHNDAEYLRQFLGICDKSIFTHQEDYRLGGMIYHDFTIVQYAALINRFDVFPVFKEMGVDFNRLGYNRNTLLHIVMLEAENPIEISRFLLENGADINALNNKGQTAVDLIYTKLDSPVKQATIKFLEDRDAKRGNEVSRPKNNWWEETVEQYLGSKGAKRTDELERSKVKPTSGIAWYNSNTFYISIILSALTVYFKRGIIAGLFPNRNQPVSQPPQDAPAATAENSAGTHSQHGNGANNHSSASSSTTRHRRRTNLAENTQPVVVVPESKEDEQKRMAEEERQLITNKAGDIKKILQRCKDIIKRIEEQKEKINKFRSENESFIPIFDKKMKFEKDEILKTNLIACIKDVYVNDNIIKETNDRVSAIENELAQFDATKTFSEDGQFLKQGNITQFLNVDLPAISVRLENYYNDIENKFKELQTVITDISSKAVPTKTEPVKKPVNNSVATSVSNNNKNKSMEDPEDKPVHFKKHRYGADEKAPSKNDLGATAEVGEYQLRRIEQRKYICAYLERMAHILEFYMDETQKQSLSPIDKKIIPLALLRLWARLHLVLLVYLNGSERAELRELRNQMSHALHEILKYDDTIISTAYKTCKTLLTGVANDNADQSHLTSDEIASLKDKIPSIEASAETERQRLLDRLIMPASNIEGVLRNYYDGLVSADWVVSDDKTDDQHYAAWVRNQIIPLINLLWCQDPKQSKSKNPSAFSYFSFNANDPLNVHGALALLCMIGAREYHGHDRENKDLRKFIECCGRLKNLEFHEVPDTLDLKVSNNESTEEKNCYLLVKPQGVSGSFMYKPMTFYYVDKLGNKWEVEMKEISGLENDLLNIMNFRSPSIEELEKAKPNLIKKYRIAIHESIERKQARELCSMAHQINSTKCKPEAVATILEISTIVSSSAPSRSLSSSEAKDSLSRPTIAPMLSASMSTMMHSATYSSTYSTSSTSTSESDVEAMEIDEESTHVHRI